MLKKLKGVDLAKLNPEQMKKIAGALAQSANKTKQASKGAVISLKSISAAKSAMKSGESELTDADGSANVLICSASVLRARSSTESVGCDPSHVSKRRRSASRSLGRSTSYQHGRGQGSSPASAARWRV